MDKIAGNCMMEIQGKLILVKVSVKFKLARVQVIRSRLQFAFFKYIFCHLSLKHSHIEAHLIFKSHS